jgi:hypothetical protein
MTTNESLIGACSFSDDTPRVSRNTASDDHEYHLAGGVHVGIVDRATIIVLHNWTEGVDARL